MQLEIILQRHAEALETEVRAWQTADETGQWPPNWKRYYNWCFAKIFAFVKIFRNWGADAAGWKLLPLREYPNRVNQKDE